MSECFSKKFPECGIFGHLVEKWFENGPYKEDGFDEKIYNEILNTIEPRHFVEFLHQFFCIYPDANKFLIDCLHQANRDLWDT